MSKLKTFITILSILTSVIVTISVAMVTTPEIDIIYVHYTKKQQKTLLEKIAMYVLKEIPHFVDLIHVSKLHRNGTLGKSQGTLLQWKTTLLEDGVAYSGAAIILEGF